MANPISRLFLNSNKAPFSLIRASLVTKPNVNIPKDPRSSLASTGTMLDRIPEMGPVHQVPSFLIGNALLGEESKWVLDGKCGRFADYESGKGIKFELARRKEVSKEEEEEAVEDFDEDEDGEFGSDDGDCEDFHDDDDDDDEEEFDDEDEEDEHPRRK